MCWLLTHDWDLQVETQRCSLHVVSAIITVCLSGSFNTSSFFFFIALGADGRFFDGEGTLFSCRGNVEEVPESLLLSDWQMIQAPRGESCHGSLLDSLLSHLGGIDGQTGRRRSGWRLELWCCLTVCDHWQLEKKRLASIVGVNVVNNLNSGVRETAFIYFYVSSIKHSSCLQDELL